MLAALLLLAAEGEKSKTPFYICAAALVLFALGLAGVGISRHETFPPSRGAATALIGVCILLVAGTMVTAVVTA
jgi:peptidoglycan/LPS O-acetylase OafA/YrhL